MCVLRAPAGPARPVRASPSKRSPPVMASALGGRRLLRAPRAALGLLLLAHLLLARLLVLRAPGVLQLDADELVRDRVAVPDVEPPPRREVLVQPPEADRERDAHEHLVDDERQNAARGRDAVAGDQVDDGAMEHADHRPR